MITTADWGNGFTENERAEIVALYPTLAPLLSDLEGPHRKLHETAVEINQILKGQSETRFAGADNVMFQRTLPALEEVRAVLGKVKEVGKALVQTDETMIHSTKRSGARR